MIVFEEEYCVIEVHEDIIIQNWIGTATEEEFKKAVLASFELVKTGKCNAIISNTQDAKPISPHLIKWLATEMNPRLISCGMKRITFVSPSDIATKLSTDLFQQVSEKQDLEIRYYRTEIEALSSLVKV